ncbi:L-lactate permease [Prosthecobacter sp.]|uniref:L-lactate permease n=1 Tax=Prosthecobacter sp. TaxID=1965333 RepID=UPI002486D1B1|nr:L-lactate permease [Prosthecobacter sp.]MDI1315077.1 L-lactate permease [Prosthecobacter sp.]
MTWSQNYDPLGNLALSSLLAALPVVTLLGLLAFWHVRAHLAALAGLVVALVVAVAGFHMPVQLALTAGGLGAVFGLFPIGWIVLNAIFIYQISVETGQFESLKKQIAGLAGDRRIQALLIAFAFGAFIEGCAGFGAPVAISGAMLIGLGFKPLEAAKLALIGNTAPVAFGSLGIPLTTLADVTGLDVLVLSAIVGLHLTIFSFIVPFWLVTAQVGWRGMVEVWPACLVCGGSFGLVQFAVSNFHGPWLVDIAAGLVTLAAMVLLLRFWKPRSAEEKKGTKEKIEHPFRAWIPWIMLSLFVGLWTTPFAKTMLNGYAPGTKAHSTWQAPIIPFAPLHLAVQKMPPVVKNPEPEKANFTFNYLSATGTALLLAGITAGLLLGRGLASLAGIYLRCLWRVRTSMLTISLMLALGYTTRFCGTDTTMGLMLAGTGVLFPFFSPLIGWLGVALTGSDTSSNVLFGNLQQVTAQQLNLSPELMVAANSSGGVMGKMIDAQSIVVASVATGGQPDSPDAGTVLRSVFWHSIALAVLMGLLVMVQAYWMPWTIAGAK